MDKIFCNLKATEASLSVHHTSCQFVAGAYANVNLICQVSANEDHFMEVQKSYANYLTLTLLEDIIPITKLM